jgi:hypothetical protein
VNLGLMSIFDLAPDGERIVGILPGKISESAETLRHVTIGFNLSDELRRMMKN